MTDRERILTHIIQIIILHKDGIKFGLFDKPSEGNLAVAISSHTPHNWIVSFYEGYNEEKDCHVVRDIITGKLCNYYNESFTEIKTQWLNKYEFLLGRKYKIYTYCRKYGTDWHRFHSLEFDDDKNEFTFKVRKPFHSEVCGTITLPTDMPLKEIKKELESDTRWVWVKEKE